jgi:hypothetical protein
MPSFPDSVFAPANRSAGQTIDASHVNGVQDEIVAIEGGYRNGTAPLNSSGSTVATLSVAGGSTFGGAVAFSTGVTVSTGTFTINQGQIVFPATQVAAAGANTLDDYEEGNWTPVIGGAGGTSGQTYSSQIGRYVKIGKLVIFQAYVALTAKGTITGNVQIQGLPFAEGDSNYPAVAFNWQALATTKVFVNGRIEAGTTVISVFGLAAAAVSSETNLVTADISNTTGFMISGSYRAAN